MRRRCSGVYSFSAVGSSGMILMIPPETLNSNRSPALIPAWRRTLAGTTRSVLFFTVTVIGVKLLGRDPMVGIRKRRRNRFEPELRERGAARRRRRGPPGLKEIAR